MAVYGAAHLAHLGLHVAQVSRRASPLMPGRRARAFLAPPGVRVWPLVEWAYAATHRARRRMVAGVHLPLVFRHPGLLNG